MPLEFGNNTDVAISGKLETSGLEDIKFTTSDVSNVLGRINGNLDEIGGELQFYTKNTNDVLDERLRLNNAGAIGIAGAIYGSPGEVLTSNGPNAPVSWGSGATTYTSGTGVSISPSNVISIGQEVGTNSSPTFLNLNVSGILSPSYVDRIQIAATDGFLSFVAGKISSNTESDLMFHTRNANTNLIERLRLNRSGAIGIAGAIYGSPGQVLTSNGPNAPVSWESGGGGTTYTPGAGLSLNGTEFINTAPDQTVVLNSGDGISITGTYPTFTISADGGITYTPGVGLSLDGTEFNNTAPDQIVVLNSGDGISITGTYPTFTISADGGGGGGGGVSEEATITTLTCDTIIGNSNGGAPSNYPADRLRVNIPNQTGNLDFYMDSSNVTISARDFSNTTRQNLSMQALGAPHNANYCAIELHASLNGSSLARLVASSLPGVISPLVTEAGNYSDDRMKFNETSLTQETAINLIQQLSIKDYMKTNIRMSPEQEQTFENGGDGFAEYKTEVDDPRNPNSFYEPFREVGVIAQQVPQDLRFIVSEGDEEKDYHVKYNNLTSLNTCVIQNILQRLSALEARN